MKLRSPIAVVLGHIDHGKTALLDAVRGTGVQLREEVGITQHIGASFLPTEVIEDLAEELVEKFNIKLTIPGILVLDTPGHEAFFNLRARGGAVADFAVLVVDVVRGFQTQTYECINLLRSRRVPFLVAANKIDLIPGWRPSGSRSFLKAIDLQEDYVRRMLDERIYELMGELSGAGFNSERFDRVRDFTKTVAIVPTSAKTGEGVAELLVVLAGLAQQYLKKRLTVSEGEAKGVVLEVKEETGLGTTIDVILYDGIIRQGDTIIIGGIKKPIITKVRSLLQPKPLDEIRDPREKFFKIKEITAAAGIKIAAPNLEETVAGSSLRVVWDESNIAETTTTVKYPLDISGCERRIKLTGPHTIMVESVNNANRPVSDELKVMVKGGFKIPVINLWILSIRINYRGEVKNIIKVKFGKPPAKTVIFSDKPYYPGIEEHTMTITPYPTIPPNLSNYSLGHQKINICWRCCGC